jgi:hypothetical protein
MYRQTLLRAEIKEAYHRDDHSWGTGFGTSSGTSNLESPAGLLTVEVQPSLSKTAHSMAVDGSNVKPVRDGRRRRVEKRPREPNKGTSHRTMLRLRSDLKSFMLLSITKSGCTITACQQQQSMEVPAHVFTLGASLCQNCRKRLERKLLTPQQEQHIECTSGL